MCDSVTLQDGKTLWSLGDLIKAGFEVLQEDVGDDVALDEAIYCWCFCCFDADAVLLRSSIEFDHGIDGAWVEKQKT